MIAHFGQLTCRLDKVIPIVVQFLGGLAEDTTLISHRTITDTISISHLFHGLAISLRRKEEECSPLAQPTPYPFPLSYTVSFDFPLPSTTCIIFINKITYLCIFHLLYSCQLLFIRYQSIYALYKLCNAF